MADADDRIYDAALERELGLTPGYIARLRAEHAATLRAALLPSPGALGAHLEHLAESPDWHSATDLLLLANPEAAESERLAALDRLAARHRSPVYYEEWWRLLPALEREARASGRRSAGEELREGRLRALLFAVAADVVERRGLWLEMRQRGANQRVRNAIERSLKHELLGPGADASPEALEKLRAAAVESAVSEAVEEPAAIEDLLALAVPALSPAEREVLEAFASGESDERTAARRGSTRSTVRGLRKRALAKLERGKTPS